MKKHIKSYNFGNVSVGGTFISVQEQQICYKNNKVVLAKFIWTTYNEWRRFRKTNSHIVVIYTIKFWRQIMM